MTKFSFHENLRMPAEWEKQKSTWIAWPHNKKDWPNKFDFIPEIFAEIISHISKGQKVNILIENNVLKKRAILILKNFKVNFSNIRFSLCKTDRAWLRDSFPIFVKNKNKKILLNVNKTNIGYGAHIKKCLNYSLKNKFDYAVMIHGDGQYSPTYIPSLLRSLSGIKNVGASTGSRLKSGRKNATKGGMPFYKLIGNILLTKIFNVLIKTNFTDTHTGLWAYNLYYLKNKKFNKLTNSFNFDQEFRFKNVIDKKNIQEIPIKTRYGDERSQLHIKYAINFFFKTIFFCMIKNKIIKSKKFS